MHFVSEALCLLLSPPVSLNLDSRTKHGSEIRYKSCKNLGSIIILSQADVTDTRHSLFLLHPDPTLAVLTDKKTNVQFFSKLVAS